MEYGVGLKISLFSLCQKQDWNTGSPPHRKICGIEDLAFRALAGTTTPGDQWGNAEPARIRSPSLLAQLMLLENSQHDVYILVPPSDAPHHTLAYALRCIDVESGLLFKSILCSASCKYNPAAEVDILHRTLRRVALSIPGYGLSALHEQLEREFGISVNETSTVVADLEDEGEIYSKEVIDRIGRSIIHATSSPSAAAKQKQDYLNRARWGTPKPGYIRSPALVHQLMLLARGIDTSLISYVFTPPVPYDDHGIRSNDRSRTEFHRCFQKAACQFSPRSVLRMYGLLVEAANRTPHYGQEELKKQLLKEYGVDIDEELEAVGGRIVTESSDITA
jgi:hypothetical protein